MTTCCSCGGVVCHIVGHMTSWPSNSFQDGDGVHRCLGLSHKWHQMVRRHSRSPTARHRGDWSHNTVDKDGQTGRSRLRSRSVSFCVSAAAHRHTCSCVVGMSAAHRHTCSRVVDVSLQTDAVVSMFVTDNENAHELWKSLSP